jgi:ribosomal protein S2
MMLLLETGVSIGDGVYSIGQRWVPGTIAEWNVLGHAVSFLVKLGNVRRYQIRNIAPW